MEDHSLFEKYYRQFGREVLNFVVRYVGNRSTAEDLTHEIFIAAHETIQKTTTWKDIKNPRAYLFAATRNHLLNHFRLRKNQRRDATTEFDELLHGKNISEDKRLEARESLRNLIKVIQQLPPRAQKAFILSRIYKYSYAEIGRKMDISPRTVERHVAIGLLTCAKLLGTTDDNNNFRESNVTFLSSHPNRLKERD